jgi:hypothetical protein
MRKNIHKLSFLAWIFVLLTMTDSVYGQLGITDSPLLISPQSLLYVHDNHVTGQIFQLTNNTSGYTLPAHGFCIALDPNFKVKFMNQFSDAGAGISFFTTDGSPVERLTILGNGNIGIGAVNPAQKLTVDGQIGLFETGSSPVFYTVLQSGNLESANRYFTLPSDYGSAGNVLTTDGSGVISWTSSSWTLTFSNGLTQSSGVVKWGGFLTEDTYLYQGGAFSLNFNNSSSGNTNFNLTSTGAFHIRTSGSSFFYGEQ